MPRAPWIVLPLLVTACAAVAFVRGRPTEAPILRAHAASAEAQSGDARRATPTLVGAASVEASPSAAPVNTRISCPAACASAR